MLNDRQLQILKLIIDDFVSTGEPIGSRTIAKKSPLGVSSATIRNEMADLEDLGFLYQPHTSSGRIPSELGYRFYVDTFISDLKLDSEKKKIIRSLLITRKISPEEIIKEAASMLSSMTGMISIISLPTFKKSRVENMKLIRISGSKVLFVLVSDKGVVKTRELEFFDISQHMLDLISDKLLEILKGFTIEDITVRSISKIKFELMQFANIIDYLIPVLKDTLEVFDDIEYYIEGVNNVIGMREFMDTEKLKKFISEIENKETVSQILDGLSKEGISVKIGSENTHDFLKECSVIKGSYSFRENDHGVIAVIGPTRLDYGKTLSFVDYFRNTLTDIFSGIVL